MKLLYTTAFGNEYRTMAQLCLSSVEKFLGEVKMLIFTDVDTFTYSDNVSVCVVDEKLNVYQKLCFRSRIKEFVSLDQYDQVWFTDPDIIFKKSPFNLFEGENRIMVCKETFTTLGERPQWFAKGIYNVDPKQNGINGGFFMVPKERYDFYEVYNKEIPRFENDLSADQQALNSIHYNKLLPTGTMPEDVMHFPSRTKYFDHYVAHYVGMSGQDKIHKMQCG